MRTNDHQNPEDYRIHIGKEHAFINQNIKQGRQTYNTRRCCNSWKRTNSTTTWTIQHTFNPIDKPNFHQITIYNLQIDWTRMDLHNSDTVNPLSGSSTKWWKTWDGNPTSPTMKICWGCGRRPGKDILNNPDLVKSVNTLKWRGLSIKDFGEAKGQGKTWFFFLL